MELRLEMSHQLSQKMMTSLSLLKLNIMDMKEYLDDLAMTNIMIESSDPAPLPELPFADKHRQGPADFDAKQFLESIPDTSGDDVTLTLLREIDHLPIGDCYKTILRYLINTLDENGYLTESEAESAAFLGVTTHRVAEAVAILQTLEPAGIGAYDLKSCLLIQLAHKGRADSPAAKIVAHYLSLVADKKYRQIGNLLNLSLPEVKEAVAEIEDLNPKPLNGLGHTNQTFYITPDFYVLDQDNVFSVLMNDYYLPEIRIHSLYNEWLHSKTIPPEDKKFLQTQLQSAKEALSYMAYRKTTLLSVANYIVGRQTEFFKQGPGHRQNLTSREIADALNVHESTISRAVSDKYFECEYGVFPLKYLICRTGNTATGQTAANLDELLRALKRIFENEDPAEPLSDAAAAEALSSQGYQLSRRTVAKYRQNLGIPTAGMRQKGSCFF